MSSKACLASGGCSPSHSFLHPAFRYCQRPRQSAGFSPHHRQQVSRLRAHRSRRSAAHAALEG
jgi:hypothetical protein